MVWTYILKALLILVLIFLVGCISKLYRVFTNVNEVVGVKNAKGWIAWGLIAEAIIIGLTIVKIITM